MMERMGLAFLFLFMALSASASSATVFSESVFESYVSTGRNLLQAKKACPVNFEFLNYTVITSRCKGPTYPATSCCAAFKDFACPYADEINDLTTDCASTMFSYINLYGKYPPGLFANECKEGKLGLACNATSPALSQALSQTASGSQSICNPSPLLMVTVGFCVLLFKLL
ncbi:hypothetical protein SLE2022_400380 [Rubroshorea leprosula]